MKLPNIQWKAMAQKAINGVKKMGKRNLAIVCALVLISSAVALNVGLFANRGQTGTLYYQGQSSAVMEDGDNTDLDGAENYFAATMITRQRTRDEALAVLQTIVSSEASLPDSVADAIAEMNRIAQDMEKESNIETMVKAKGFAECVAVLGEGKCSVVVKSDGLLPSQIAQIQEIVYEQTGILPKDVKMIEKKA